MSQDQYSPYQSLPTDTSPRPFGEIPGLWLKVLEMTEEFFAQEWEKVALGMQADASLDERPELQLAQWLLEPVGLEN